MYEARQSWSDLQVPLIKSKVLNEFSSVQSLDDEKQIPERQSDYRYSFDAMEGEESLVGEESGNLQQVNHLLSVIDQKDKQLSQKDALLQEKEVIIIQLKLEIKELLEKLEGQKQGEKKAAQLQKSNRGSDKKNNQENEEKKTVANETDLEESNQKLNQTLSGFRKREKEIQKLLELEQQKNSELERKLAVMTSFFQHITGKNTLKPKDELEARVLAEIQSPSSVDVEAEKVLEELNIAINRENPAELNEIADMDVIEVDFKVASFWMTESEKRQCLIQFLTDSSRDFETVKLLGKIFPTGNDADIIVRSLLEIYQEQDKALNLVFSMIDYEVAHTKSPIQLFRGEEFPPRMIRTFTRMIGLEFAHKVLGELICEIIDWQIQIEINPNEFPETDSPSSSPYPSTPGLPDLEENISLLNHYSQLFFDAIYDSLPFMPIQFIQIAHHLTQTVRNYFPDPKDAQSAVAGFIFLRFFGPCIASPETFDFPDPGPMSVRRTLLLIGKVLQCLANGVTSFKETYLSCMIPFLERNKKKFEDFVRQFATWPPKLNPDIESVVRCEVLIAKQKEKMKSLFSGTVCEAKIQRNEIIETQPYARTRTIL
uniref:Ras-GAP domain-containing protein n=1 Tax=Arcella intermedia TaxID=1963864 RepID=A0A6B2L073_9EUKA